MIVIVEGIDRVGKTTLCDMLSKEIDFPTFKHDSKFDYSKMDNENETDKMLQMLTICKIGNVSVVFDRFHLSDFVYGVLDRGYDKEKAYFNFLDIEKNMQKENTLLVLVEPTDIKISSEKHGKDLSEHNKMFKCLFKKSVLKKIKCDYKTLNNAINFIMEENKK